MSASRILVCDGETRSALAAVRSLGAAGHAVELVAHQRQAVAGASRYVSRVHGVPDPAQEPRAWCARVVEIAGEGGFDFLLPLTDVSIGTLHAFEGPLPCEILGPDRSTLEAVNDKQGLMERAKRLGVAVPRGIALEDPRAFDGASSATSFPAVVKPRRSRFLREGRWQSCEVSIARDPDELASALAAPDAAGGVLLQEYLPGHGEAIFVLADRGKVRVRFAHRRLREKPPTGGVSVLRESIPVDPALLAASEALLGDLRFHGVAMVEFRRHPDGRAFLMEINPRLWGSLQLAIDSGVDFPNLLLALHRGAELPAVRAQEGTRTRWLLGDVDHLLIAWRRSAVRQLTGISRFRSGARFLQSFFDGTRLEVLRWDDPRPFLRELRSWFLG